MFIEIFWYSRKKNKTIGIVKVCFDCMAHQIYGSSANTDNFGKNGDYSKLAYLLN